MTHICYCSLGPQHPDCCINNTQRARDERLGRLLREQMETRMSHPSPGTTKVGFDALRGEVVEALTDEIR